MVCLPVGVPLLAVPSLAATLFGFITFLLATPLVLIVLCLAASLGGLLLL